jgi:hypothetical protein
MMGSLVTSGGGGVFMPGIIQFPDGFEDIENDESSKKSVSNEDLDEDVDLKQTRINSKRQHSNLKAPSFLLRQLSMQGLKNS